MRRTLAISIAAGLVAAPSIATAAWSDRASVSATMTAHTIASPTLSCRPELVGVTFEWTAVSGASYTFYLSETSSGEPVTGTSKYVPSLVGGGTATVVANRSFGATTWSSARSNPVSWGSLVLSGCK